jgi:hypothetical protein
MQSVNIGLYKHYDRLRVGTEINYDTRASSVNSRMVGTYDFIRYKDINAFAGVAAGVGWAQDNDYKLLIGEGGSYGLTGVCDARIGLRYEIKDNLNIKLEYKLDHISRLHQNDMGSNDDVVMVWLEWRF